jgi:hypothetical protein
VPARAGEHQAVSGILRSSPRSGADHDRQHRSRGDLATHRHNNRELEQWEYEVTSGGRVRYVIDDANHTVWLIYASLCHPKEIERHKSARRARR